MVQIKITVPGIKKALKGYKYLQAIGEYIWNGFDAEASIVEIIIEANQIGNISELRIKDNGYGIAKEKLATKFVPFFESDKELKFNPLISNSAIHGKNGVGRLTFFNFANVATWETVYEKNGNQYKYKINVNVDKLDTYTDTEIVETQESTGTTVCFQGIKNITKFNFETDIKEYLIREFSWFLELNKTKDFCIKINGDNLDYSSIIGEETCFNLHDVDNTTSFDVRYIQWNSNINDEYSRYYFITSEDKELFKEATTLNLKGDRYYHSVFIKSSYFDNFNFVIDSNSEQGVLSGHSKKDSRFKYLIAEIDRFLRQKRKPFLKAFTEILINEYERDGVFPKYNAKNPWDASKKEALEEVVKGLYQVEPKIFSGLNIEQKKTFVRLLNLIMDADELDNLLEILEGIVDLDKEDRQELARLLSTTKLSRIIKTVKLIEDRYKVINGLKALVFDDSVKANERDHLQKLVEKHYWMFGEQYNLVAAAEDKFEQVLEKYVYLLRGEKKTLSIDHPDKKKEIDILIVRRDFRDDFVRNIIVELKHKNIPLGMKQVTQVEEYMNVIIKQPDFNASNMNWEFYLVGNEFSSDGYIKNRIQSASNHGERSLILKTDNYKVYAKTWSEILTECELRHNFLMDKLELEKQKLLLDSTSPDQIVDELNGNSAIQPEKVKII